jgi:hypothetical protein
MGTETARVPRAVSVSSLDNQLCEITEDEANRIVERIRRSVSGQP